MMMEKMKVVWICHFSNPDIRSKLSFGFYVVDVIRKFFGKQTARYTDSAQWNTNGVKEFEKFNDVDLSIIMPVRGIKGRQQQFELNGVHYYCFRSEDDNFCGFFLRRLNNNQYLKNRSLIQQLITKISPDIIHVIGAENPYYSLAALDVAVSIPVIVQLQTLLSVPGFYEKYSSISFSNYKYRSEIEKKIILRADYVGTTVLSLRETILNTIKPDCKFLDTSLAVGQEIDKNIYKKEYDFVYFAANIEKAADHAIEAFGIAVKSKPLITLNIVGGYNPLFKKKIDQRIKELGISDHVFFSGKQLTHDDVMRQIKKSKYALLPLKVDVISGTVRESMACGLPVVTTVTDGTPLLNSERQSVLLSDIGDYEGMAQNMVKLIESDSLYESLRTNAFLTFEKKWSNKKAMEAWVKAYHQVLKSYID